MKTLKTIFAVIGVVAVVALIAGLSVIPKLSAARGPNLSVALPAPPPAEMPAASPPALAQPGAAVDAPKIAKEAEGRRELERNAEKAEGGRDSDGIPDAADKDEKSGGEGHASAPSRAWFPETFLFDPLVVTDDAGKAEVSVRVPDRLTRWRILALAHSRAGAQAGAVADFQGTLPAYVDPVLPRALRAGDLVRLPIQLVNTTSESLSEPLRVEATGAVISSPSGSVRVPGQSSTVEYVTLHANQAGRVTVRASLGGADSVVRTLDVLPVGRPVQAHASGTLAAARTTQLSVPSDAEAASSRVRLLVFPGALAVLRSELNAASSRSGADADAYALLLAGRAPTLLHALGEEPDLEALRTLTLVVAQRAMRWGRAPDAAMSTLFTEPALAHPDRPMLARLGERLAANVAQNQRADGTCLGADGWTLQRVLVATAECVRATRAAASTEQGKRRAASVEARALGAFERQLDRVDDGFTAAAILNSGIVTGSMAETLRDRVRTGIQSRPDGSRALKVESGAVRSDGSVPSEVEATALAALALEGDAKAPLADLGSFLLGHYQPGTGWGDGRANLSALRAVLMLFKDPVPAHVQVLLEMDGKVVTEGTLEGKALREVLALEAAAPAAAGPHAWTVRATPAVPGLGYALTVESWVPWKVEKADHGMDLELRMPKELRAGVPAPIELTATAPAGIPFRIRQSLPTGVQCDSASLDALVARNAISSFHAEDGWLTIDVSPLAPGQTFRAAYRLIPTLAGTLHASASSIEPMGQGDLAFYVPSPTWAVRGARGKSRG